MSVCHNCNRDTMSTVMEAGEECLQWCSCCGSINHVAEDETLAKESPMAYQQSIEALQAIVDHQESMGGGLAVLSTTRRIAQWVLDRYQPDNRREGIVREVLRQEREKP